MLMVTCRHFLIFVVTLHLSKGSDFVFRRGTAHTGNRQRALQASNLGINVSYNKESFQAQAQVARDAAAYLSATEEAVTPEILKRMVESHTLMYSDIYGACIVFEPDSYPLTNGTIDPSSPDLRLGVPSTDGIDADGNSYWNNSTEPWTLPLTELWNGTSAYLYAPYAHKSGSDVNLLDLSDGYNYFDATVDWYHGPRTLFLDGSLKFSEGYWSEPYYDAGAGNTQMVTFSVPFWRKLPVPNISYLQVEAAPPGLPPQKVMYDSDGVPHHFWGIATIDISLKALTFDCGRTEVWDPVRKVCSNCSAGRYRWSPEDEGRSSSASQNDVPECRSCDAGRYSPEAGSTICERCEVGEYQPQRGKTACIQCALPGSTTSFEGADSSSDCGCPPGYSVSGDAPNQVCAACPSGKFSTKFGTKCESCPLGQVAASGSTICGCPVGYELIGGHCSPCPMGTYKDTVQGVCISCPEDEAGNNLTTLAVAATTGGQCTKCHFIVQGYCISLAMLFISSMIPFMLMCCGYVTYLRIQERSLWRIDPAELIFGDPVETLGRGNLGLVLKAEYRGTIVAVKRVIPPDGKRVHVNETFRVRAFGSGAPSTPALASGEFLDQVAMTSVTTDSTIEGDCEKGFKYLSKKSSTRTRMKTVQSYSRLRREFIHEMRVLSKLRHPCVTTVMGAVISRSTEPMLVMEYMDHGSLYDLLHNVSMVMEGELVLPILRDIAQGLRFLHATKPKPLVHGDLKAQNVLVDARFRAKVADFGLSHKQKTGACGTPFWMAPELLQRDGGQLTTASDVYAFGIVLIEVFTREDPYVGEDSLDVCKDVRNPAIAKRPKIPTTCCAEVAALMRECWQHNLVLRPGFEELDRRLQLLDSKSRDLDVCTVKQRKEELTRRTDELLFDIFPKHVAEALRAGKKVEPESFEVVTIFFSDIVGFTDISSTLEPQKVSCMLDRLYEKFDMLSREFAVFKVETIGDAYMAVTNLVEDQKEDHAARIARFAIRAIAAANETAIDKDDPSKGYVDIRVGFHSGPVVANVVGTRNLRYCLFGDTVNTASRMESNSIRNCIHCSPQAAKYLLEQRTADIAVTSRGTIAVKGKGMMETFWVSPCNGTRNVCSL